MRKDELSGDLWPAHPKPQEDELLSSWLFRIALAHGLNPVEFSSIVWPGKRDFFTHLDEKEDSEILEVLARKTGTPLDRVQDIPLASYESWLYSTDERNSNKLRWLRQQVPWIMPVSNTSAISLFGLQFCPHCLKEKPYFRRRWRLAFVVICESHRVQLQDRCPDCEEPINLQSRKSLSGRRLSDKALILCQACGLDLRQPTPHPIQLAVSNDEVEYQRFLIDTLQKGWIEIPDRGAVYSHLYFTVLHKLMRRLSVGKDSDFLRAVISKHYRIPIFTISFPTWDRLAPKTITKHKASYKYVELLNVAERRGLLRMVARLLSNWPSNYISFCKANLFDWHGAVFEDFDNKLTWLGPLFDGMRYIPFWYWSVVHDHLVEKLYRMKGHEKEYVFQSRYIVEDAEVGRNALGSIMRVKARPSSYRPIDHYQPEVVWKSEEIRLIEEQRLLRYK
jgi:hypothetical protein